MRKFYMIALLAFLFIGNTIAQDVLVVEPGLGTLNAAILANGGDKIYELTAGEWYGLDAPIENVDYHLQIIGSAPAEAGGKPATLQTGSDVNGAVFSKMFDSKGDITLKNIFIVNADLNAQVGFECLVESKMDARIVVDNCVFHPSCVGQGVTGSGGGNKCYFTNNQVVDHGHMLSPNDGHFFNFSNTAAGKGLDSLWVENNTFICMGMNVFQGSFGDMVNNVVAFNHNTFVFAKSQIDWTTKKMEQYWTNNLMFDLQVNAYANNWQPMPGGDPSKPKPNLIYADTLTDEVMPSTRPNFVEYNALYRGQGFYDLIDEMNIFCKEQTPKLPGVYLYPLVWPRDTLNSREAQMFGSTDFPKFKFGNYIADVDPEWTDATIYDHEALMIEWASPANYVHALGQPSTNYPPATEWAQYWWIPSGDLSDNSVWPLFDGTYTNEQYLKGSIEMNVPLGDLNWWPEAKAAWELKKADVWAHIQAGNESQIDIGFGTTTNTVVDIIVGSPDHNTLEAAVIAAELADDLSGDGPFTVFAPTDAAFAALPEGTVDALLEDPTGALADILLYHVVSGKVMSTDLSDGQVAPTLLGKDITVTINGDGVFINDAKVTVADIEADNGVVHVIDAVLIPPTGEPASFPIDFETETDAVWEIFGNGTAGTMDLSVIDNPDKSGINTSDKVLKFIVNVDADPWAGTYSDSYPTIEFTEANHTISMMVWKDNTNPVGIKVESPTNGGTVTEVKVPVTQTSQWVEATADFSAAIGFGFARLTIFPDFPDTRTAGATVYIDNIVVAGVTGTVDVKSEGLFAYPNPANDILNVKGGKNADITIMNIDGRVVRNVRNVSYVNVSDLAKGIYSVTIKSGKEVSIQKVVISR